MGHDRDTENPADDRDPDCVRLTVCRSKVQLARWFCSRGLENVARKRTHEMEQNHYWLSTCMLFCEEAWIKVEMCCKDRERCRDSSRANQFRGEHVRLLNGLKC